MVVVVVVAIELNYPQSSTHWRGPSVATLGYKQMNIVLIISILLASHTQSAVYEPVTILLAFHGLCRHARL